MRTEARRKYTSGFVLGEQELRRIHDVVDQQIKKALPTADYETKYEVRFKNGAIAEPTNLDEILDQENWGSSAIRLVSLTCQEKVAQPHVKISVRFADAEQEDDWSSMSYKIEGEDRDWVFVASSQLSERIARVERPNVTAFSRSRHAASLLAIVFMFAMLGSMLWTTNRRDEQAAVQSLKEAWIKGDLNDPIDAMLKIEELRLDDQRATRFIWPTFIIPLAIMMLWYGGFAFLRYALPPHNFVWGEYQRDYEKRRGRVRFVLAGVLLTVVLGIAANIITKKFGF